jgi:tyrosyl-tRNA synthetase
MKKKNEAGRQYEIIARGTSSIFPEDALKERIAKSIDEKTPLRVKLGVDPTSPDVHLGFAVVLEKLREFQNLGHKAILVIGDYSARVGDPTGRANTRPTIMEEEIRSNFQTYLDQVGRIIDKSTLEITYNGKWYREMQFVEIVDLMSRIKIRSLLDREDFKNRFANEIPIYLHEMFYPLVQGYDSVMVRADVELGGEDQIFNLQFARDVQKSFGQEEQVCVTMPLLPGSNGVMKMSKSYGNHIGIAEPPEMMFEKILALPEWVLEQYFKLLLRKPPPNRGGGNPNLILAREIVGHYHPEADLLKIETKLKHKSAAFDACPRRRVTVPPLDIVGGKIPAHKLLTLLGIARSQKDAFALAKKGAVKFDGKKLSDASKELAVKTGNVLQLGDLIVELQIPGKNTRR